MISRSTDFVFRKTGLNPIKDNLLSLVALKINRYKMTSLPRWFGKKKKKVLPSSETTIISSSLNPADPYTSMLFLDLLQFHPGVYRLEYTLQNTMVVLWGDGPAAGMKRSK